MTCTMSHPSLAPASLSSRRCKYLFALAATALALGACNKSAEAPPAAATAPGGGSTSASAPATSGVSATATAPASSNAAGSASSSAAPASPAASAPPVSVTTIVARKRDLPVVLEATGAVAPTLTVEVRPQITSVVKQVHVREGQSVRAGQPLFTLDATADEANIARLRAQLARDEAGLADAQRQFKRSRELLAQNFISQGAVDTSQTQVETQAAAVAASKAAVDAARVPLGYARIAAPSAGRVGAINLFPGSSVQANQTTLVTITQLDPIDIAFTVPQRYLAEVLAAVQGSGAEVAAMLPDSPTTLTGRLVFVDNAIDAASGTVKVKARFPNKESVLWPGAFVRIGLTVRALKDAVVIPQAAIVQGARGTVVFVAETGKAALRPVQVLATQGEDAAVSGLRPGERVILDGRQNVRPGSPVIERPREGGGGGGGRPGGASGAGRGEAAAASAAASSPGKRASS